MQRKTILNLCFAVTAIVLASQSAKAESLYDKGYKDALAHLQPNNDAADYQEGWHEGHEQAGSAGMENEEPADSQEQQEPQEAEPETQSDQ